MLSRAAFFSRIAYHGRMGEALPKRLERRTRQRAANRAAILDAARQVAAREGAAALSLRAVAAQAGYAPASVYEYFRNRAELVLALASEDLSQIARVLREHPAEGAGKRAGALGSAAAAALELIAQSGALAAVASTLESAQAPPEAERIFNGRLIGLLTALADSTGRSPLKTREEQVDVVLAAAAIAGLAVLLRAGRLKALGFDEKELLAGLDRRFG